MWRQGTSTYLYSSKYKKKFQQLKNSNTQSTQRLTELQQYNPARNRLFLPSSLNIFIHWRTNFHLSTSVILPAGCKNTLIYQKSILIDNIHMKDLTNVPEDEFKTLLSAKWARTHLLPSRTLLKWNDSMYSSTTFHFFTS